MPNRRGTIVEPDELEKANPWQAGRFDQEESQEDRGAPGSRGRGKPAAEITRGLKGEDEHHKPKEWTGVNPLPPIDPSMPVFKPGDQGG